MTGTTTARGSTAAAARRGGAVFWMVLVAVLFVVALVGGRPAKDGDPLSPDATGPLGTKALVLTLEDLGARVDTVEGVPPAGVDVALLLQDKLDEATREQLRQWVIAGGTLVVADPGSLFAPVPAGSADPFGVVAASSIPPEDCTIDALSTVGRIDARGGLAFQVDGSTGHCFGDTTGAFVVATAAGRGTVVALGGAGLFTNESLGTFDNAVLAGALLAPSPGGTVAFLEPPAPGSGDATLGELVAPGVKAAMWQLAIAFVLYALWRARRLGRPIEEPQPVQIAGSELVGAVGELLQQTRSPDRAAAVLRDDLRRSLCGHLGLAVGSPPDVVATITARRTGADAETVYDALAGPPVTSDHELVALAQTIESIRKELLHGSRT